MTCKQCNFEIGNQKYCPNCGTDNSVQQAQPTFEVPMQNQQYTAPMEQPAFTQPEMPQQPVFQQDFGTQDATPQVSADNPYNQYVPNTPHGQQYVAQQQTGFTQQNYMPQQQYAPQPEQYAPQADQYGQQYGQQPYNQQSYAPQNNPYAQQSFNSAPATMEDPAKGKATGALICGICSIVFAWLPLVGIILGVIAMIMSKKYDETGSGLGAGKAKGGKITGIIGLILSGLWIIGGLIGILLIWSSLSALAEYAVILPFFI